MRSNESSAVNAQPPLSWKEARHRLRESLENYLDHQPAHLEKKRRQMDPDDDEKISFLGKWLKWDLDIYYWIYGVFILTTY